MATVTDEGPKPGALVQVRGQRWVVSTVDEGNDRSTLVTLQSVEDGRYGDTLSVIWEVEPGRRTLPSGSLPEVTQGKFDSPERLAAFLDAVRWGAVASADVKTLQAPFRSGVAIEDYQLEPVARALDAPRVNLLLADDVGLGKTIEAGLVAQELLLRQRGRKILIVCPVNAYREVAGRDGREVRSRLHRHRLRGVRQGPPHARQCREPVRGLPARDRVASVAARREGAAASRRGPSAGRPHLSAHVRSPHPGRGAPRGPAAPKQIYAIDSQQTKLIRRLAQHFTHRLFLSATPTTATRRVSPRSWKSWTTSVSPVA